MSENNDSLRNLVATVAAAYFSNSHVSATDIPAVIAQIAGSLGSIGTGAAPAGEAPQAEGAPAQKLTSAQIRKSITPDALISFEDGRSYKTMKRHLSGRGLTPEQYRDKWGLPRDYPMVAPNYSEARAAMAKKLGLGQRGAQARAAAAADRAAAPKARRGRKPV